MIKRPGLVFLFAIAAGVLALTWQSFRTPAIEQMPTPGDEPRYYLDAAVWTRYDQDGAPLQRVASDHVELLDDDSARLREVRVDQLGGEQGAWTLRAPRGVSPAGSERLRLEGGVTVSGRWPEDQPLNLTTEKLWVDAETREIYTDTPVAIAGQQRSLDAGGMRADWNADRVQLQSKVKVRYDTDR